MFYVYIHTNKINGKKYVGQTVNTKNRWLPCKYKESKHFYAAIQKYGWKNFEHEIICQCEENVVDDVEREWIKFWDTTNPEKGYNSSLGGQDHSTRGIPCSEETKKKISIANSGKYRAYSDEEKEKISKKGKGRIFSEEHKRKISEAHKGKNCRYYKINKKILCIETNIIYSIEEICEKFNLKRSTIINTLNPNFKYQKTAGGYHWRYLDD